MPATLLPEAPLAADPSCLEAWESDLTGLFGQIFRPTPRLSLSEWADEYRHLSKETSAEPGPWRTSRVPYLREPMDAVSDPDVRKVVIEKSARVGYTEGILGNGVGYFIHQDPSPQLIVFPTENLDAKDWSQKQLAPMIRDTPALAAIIAEPRARESGNTILDKQFPGGSITIRGAQSAKGLRRHTARFVALDEIDGYPASSGDEGDPVKLAERAARTFPHRKIVLGSTPTKRDTSRIHKEFQKSDQRRYHVPCPHCEELQVLKWGGPDKPHGIKWAKEVFCKACGTEADPESDECSECASADFAVTHLPETAHYVCRHCGEAIEERQKATMVAAGEWIPEKPRSPIRGYHITALVSLFEGASWANMVREFLEAKDDPDQLQVFVNQWLGEPWEEQGSKVEASGLERRTEVYVDAAGEPVVVPDGVGVLTAGVDVQGDRLELLVRGWGCKEESWDIAHHRIYGDPRKENTWGRLEALLTKEYPHGVSGMKMRILATMIDSGYDTDVVYRFVRNRQARNVWASKGDNGRKGNEPLRRPKRPNSEGVRLFTIGTFYFKRRLLRRLTKVVRPGPGYIHLRQPDRELCNGFDAEYFAQAEAEKLVKERVRGSRQFRERFRQVRDQNEFIDLQVLADAALHALGAGIREKLCDLAEALREGRNITFRKKRRGRVRSKGVEV